MNDPGAVPGADRTTLAPDAAVAGSRGRGRVGVLVGLGVLAVLGLLAAGLLVARGSSTVETGADGLPSATGKGGGGASRGTKPGGELIELEDLIPGSRGTIILEDGSVIEDPNPASTTTTATTAPGSPPVTNGSGVAGANGSVGAGAPGDASGGVTPGGGLPAGQNPGGQAPVGQVPGGPVPGGQQPATTAPPDTTPEVTVTVPDTTPADTTPDDTVSSPPNTLGPPPSTPKVTLGPGVTFKLHPQINAFSGPRAAGCTLAVSKFVTSVKLTWDTSFTAAVTVYVDKTEVGTFSGDQVDATVSIPFGCGAASHVYTIVAENAVGTASSSITISRTLGRL